MAYRISAQMLIIIGKNLKNVRRNQKREQVEVAEEAGINPSYYARLERGEGNPTLAVLYSVIRALHVKSSDILPF